MKGQRTRIMAGSLALMLAMCLILPAYAEKQVAASDGSSAAAREISMSEFCAKDSENQSNWIVDVSNVEDLDNMREFLEENPTGKGNTFNQTCDIVVSSYTYEYLDEYGRIAIYYDGEPEVYYDIAEDSYYENPSTTGSAITYTWKTSSWNAIGGELESRMYADWKYEGNQHTIEGIYQKITSKSSKKNTGLFYNAAQISGVQVKNYFGIAKDTLKSSVLGNGLEEVKACGGESVKLISRGDSLIGNAGFVAELSGDITDTKVEADIFTTGMEVDVTLSPDSDGGGRTGIIAGESVDYAVSNCESMGRIFHVSGRRQATGGIVGFTGGKSRILNCVSSVKIQGDISSGGGIVGCAGSGSVLDGCRFLGSLKVNRAGKYLTNLPNAGGICGVFAGSYLNNCQNDGRIESNRGGIGGIVGYFADGEVLNCINRGTIIGGVDEDTGNEENATDDVDESLWAMAGGIAGRLRSNGTGAMEIALYNSLHEGDVNVQRGAAGGIVGCMEADHSEVANVCSVGKVSSELEADAVTGLWKAGERGNCLDGRELEPEALCELLNQWIVSLGTSDTEHYMVDGAGSEMYSWSVVDEKLTLLKPAGEPEESASPAPSGKPESSASPAATDKVDGDVSPAPSEKPEPSASPATTDKVDGNASPIPDGTATPSKNPESSVSPTPTDRADGNASPTPSENPELSASPMPSGKPESSVSPTPTDRADGNASPTPSGKPESSASPTPTDKVDGSESPAPSENPESSTSPTPTDKPEGSAGSTPNSMEAKKTKWKAPTFKLSRKVNSQNQKYIQVTLKKYKGKYVQVWVKIEGQRYRRIKLSENRILKLHGKLKFKYSFSNKTIYFKLRTYGRKNGKKVYSAKSKGKRITTK